jgi:hypothetical protein
MLKCASSIADLFEIPTRFLRSVQVERDFSDPTALDNYLVTPHVAEAFTRIVDGLRTTSGRRAWRITGDYGVGKSCFALALAHILEGRGTVPGLTINRSTKTPSLWPILLNGVSRTVSSGHKGFSNSCVSVIRRSETSDACCAR